MNASKPRLSILPSRVSGASRGFSAIEVTAVAAIIFTLALILVPIVNKRVDESKRVSAQDDMVAIEKAEQLAFGYTGHYFRLHDLVRPQPDPSELAPDTNGNIPGQNKVPPAFWNRLPTPAEKSTLVRQWTGPYLPQLNTQRSITLEALARDHQVMINTAQLPPSVTSVTPGNGPIFLSVLDDVPWAPVSSSATPVTDGAFRTTKYPVDPWGNPYLFFGDGLYGDYQQSESRTIDLPADQQINYTSCAVYSLGPDGVPGDLKYWRIANQTPQGRDYFRESPRADGSTIDRGAALGAGDDLKREF